MEPTKLCATLFDAFASGDFETVHHLCAEDLQASQNNGPAMDLSSLIGFTTAVLEIVQNFRYEEARRSATETGFVEEHLVRGTLPDGTELNLSACVVGVVVNGKITRLREYVDSAAAQDLIKALA